MLPTARLQGRTLVEEDSLPLAQCKSDPLLPSATSHERFNIASYLPHVAEAAPDRAAVVVSKLPVTRGPNRGATIRFAELEALSNQYANGLSDYGISRGMRVLVMVRPGVDFVALVFALFKMGTVSVMIDPGMGVNRLLECVRKIDLHALVGIPLAQVMRVVRRSPFKSVKYVVTVGRRWFWGGATLSEFRRQADDHFSIVDTAADEAAAILFTSGSTGPAKGVVYEHGVFGAQVRTIQSHYGIEPGEVDLPAFPLFALFSIAMGMTTVIPEMDPSHPARVDPAKFVRSIREFNVTSTFGSPAIWNRVAPYCVENHIKLPSLRRVLIAGAPVPYRTIKLLHRVLNDDADVHTPYGATESLPVSSISGRELLGGCSDRTRVGAGTCVGLPLPETDLRIIRISDDPIGEWSTDLAVPDGQIGEIVVAGPVVTKEYFRRDRANELAKIRDGGRVWHRIGDVGYRDEQGRIWFCGRKAHCVVTENGTQYSVQCEAIFNEHRDVRRSALIGIGKKGRQEAVLVVEPQAGRFPGRSRCKAFRAELLELGRDNELTRDIHVVLFHRSLPVDIRHNAKIDREALAEWAARRSR